MRRPHEQEGFTLVELMIAMALGLTLLFGLISMYLSQQRVAETQRALSQQTGDALAVSTYLTRELRRAGRGLANPLQGLTVVDDGIEVRYRRPGETDVTVTQIVFDPDAGTLSTSDDGGVQRFPIHQPERLGRADLLCAVNTTGPLLPCVTGTNPLAVSWDIELLGDDEVRARSIEIFVTSRNAIAEI